MLRMFPRRVMVVSILVITWFAVNQVGAGSVMLYIGDGMGFAQREAARVVLSGPHGCLAMDLPHLALMITSSVSGWTTDSAVGATAIATGHRTRNRAVGVDSVNTPLLTILELAHAVGLSTGLVTTDRLSGATPAAFVAHVPDRVSERAICRQIVAGRPTVLLGGGRRYWLPQTQDEDREDLVATARTAGYTVVTTTQELLIVRPTATTRLLGLFADDVLSYVVDRTRDKEPSLELMTAKALEVLTKHPKGFFVMVEGARLDHAAHQNDALRTVMETLAFDKKSLDFSYLNDYHSIYE